MMRPPLFALFLVVADLLMAYGAAEAKMPAFVADALQAAPGIPARNGKLYATGRGTRFEFKENGQNVIQIIEPARGLYRLLFPDTKTYFEVKGKPSSHPNGERPVDPCQPAPGLECRRVEEVDATSAGLEQWVVKTEKATSPWVIWWDRARRMPVRQTFPDGGRMVAEESGTTQFEGRTVEQWKLTITPKTGNPQYSYMLYAPDLGIPVMEQGATGLVKELHNIQPLTSDAGLFDVPEGYRLVTPSSSSPQSSPR